MNLLRPIMARRTTTVPRVIEVTFCSTNVSMAVASPSKDSLHRRIMQAGDPTISMADVVIEWVGEGNQVKHVELKQSVKVLRQHGRCKHALQLLEWMNEQMKDKLTNPNAAICLDLIAKVHGPEEAQKYLERIPEKSRDFRIYGALISCYAHEKSVENAEATMQKMRELGYARNLSYNIMLKLYLQTRQYEKMDALMQEMKERGMDWDNYTYSIRLNAYALIIDVEGMNKLLSEMESDPCIKMDWSSYSIVANGYLKAGLQEKALAMMKKAEQLINVKDWKRTFAYLLTQYSKIGNQNDLYRIWNQYKKKGKFNNSTYLAMLTSLVRLDDIAGAEKLVKEWEYRKTSYDIRIPRFLIVTYCKKGHLEKAEAFMKQLGKIGEELDASLWDALASGYTLNKEMPKALEALKKSIQVSKYGRRPDKFTLAACLGYLKEKGEVGAAHELLSSLRKTSSFPEEVYEALLTYVNSDMDRNLEAINQLEDARNQSGELSASESEPKDKLIQ
ncbi:hypothetical protein SAY86_010707 [Trapa natans]|uniref:Pentatricopeptide repeat-containing protein n=1 Tax=Trapa natans TaxID=22666 RepID=A0AAN7R0D3_TRANT|nr:hypothetical protein SAY86_010707 [Trapa natans]